MSDRENLRDDHAELLRRRALNHPRVVDACRFPMVAR